MDGIKLVYCLRLADAQVRRENATERARREIKDAGLIWPEDAEAIEAIEEAADLGWGASKAENALFRVREWLINDLERRLRALETPEGAAAARIVKAARKTSLLPRLVDLAMRWEEGEARP